MNTAYNLPKVASYNSANHATNNVDGSSDWDKNANDLFQLGVGNAIVSGFSSFNESYKNVLQGQMTARNYQAQADSYNYQANMAMQNMFNAYRQGAWEAMDMGIKDRQKLADIKTANASSGVKMTSGSKKELEASQRLIHAQNQKALRDNIEAQASQYRQQAVNMQAQAIVAKGNAQAQNMMASSWSPFINGFMTVGSGIAKAYYGADMYNKGLYSAKDAL